VAIRSKLTEDNVFLSQNGLRLCLTLLNRKQSHFLKGCLKDCCFPKVHPLPYFALINLWDLVNEFFDLLINPIKRKDQTEKASDDENIIFLLTFLQDYSNDFPTYLSVVGRLYNNFMLQSVFFNED
jgi:hypothetical protein